MKMMRSGHELRAYGAGVSPRPESGNSVDLSDLVARIHPAEATTPPAAGLDLTNVIPFTRHRAHATLIQVAPAIAVSAAERPAPAAAETHRGLKWAVLLLVSLAAHVCLYLPFGREPTPMTSVGEVSMSVELVLAAQTPAGLSPQASPSETPAPQPQQALEPAVEPPKPEPETRPTEILQAEPTPAETPPPMTEPPPPPTEPPAPVDEPPPTDPQPTEPPPAETPPPISEPPPPPMEPPAPVEEPTPTEPPARVQQIAPPRAKLPAAKPEAAKREAPRPRAAGQRRPETRGATARVDRNESRTRTPAATAASGVGPGRSEANTNYRGIVAAHLARYKQFPAEARDRGNQGSAVVTFALNGGGRVSSVSLSRGTGVAALDQEAVTMVRRASPFPAPPDGRAVSFTVPVSFRLQ